MNVFNSVEDSSVLHDTNSCEIHTPVRGEPNMSFQMETWKFKGA